MPGEKIVTDNGVTIIGYTDLTSRMPTHTSQLYGTNIVNLLKLLTPGKDGQLVLDMDDIVQRSITVTRGRRDAVAAAAGAGLRRAEAGRRRSPAPHVPTPQELAEQASRKQQRRYALFGLAAVAVGAGDHLLAAQLPRATSPCSCWRCSSAST